MNFNDDPAVHPEVYPEPESTSLLSIFGFILSLGGCIAGITALLGLPISLVALIGIGRSNGRLGGKGFAIAGTAIGLLNLLAWGGCLGGITLGVQTGINQFGSPAARALESLQSGDLDAARANLLSPAADVDNAEILAFQQAYQASLGEFESIPSGTIDYFSQFFEVAPVMQSISGQQEIFPIPARFTGGTVLIVVKFDPNGAGVKQLTLIGLNGDEFSLPMRSGWDKDPASTDETPSQTDETDPKSEPDSEPPFDSSSDTVPATDPGP